MSAQIQDLASHTEYLIDEKIAKRITEAVATDSINNHTTAQLQELAAKTEHLVDQILTKKLAELQVTASINEHTTARIQELGMETKRLINETMPTRFVEPRMIESIKNHISEQLQAVTEKTKILLDETLMKRLSELHMLDRSLGAREVKASPSPIGSLQSRDGNDEGCSEFHRISGEQNNPSSKLPTNDKAQMQATGSERTSDLSYDVGNDDDNEEAMKELLDEWAKSHTADIEEAPADAGSSTSSGQAGKDQLALQEMNATQDARLDEEREAGRSLPLSAESSESYHQLPTNGQASAPENMTQHSDAASHSNVINTAQTVAVLTATTEDGRERTPDTNRRDENTEVKPIPQFDSNSGAEASKRALDGDGKIAHDEATYQANFISFNEMVRRKSSMINKNAPENRDDMPAMSAAAATRPPSDQEQSGYRPIKEEQCPPGAQSENVLGTGFGSPPKALTVSRPDGVRVSRIFLPAKSRNGRAGVGIRETSNQDTTAPLSGTSQAMLHKTADTDFLMSGQVSLRASSYGQLTTDLTRNSDKSATLRAGTSSVAANTSTGHISVSSAAGPSGFGRIHKDQLSVISPARQAPFSLSSFVFTPGNLNFGFNTSSSPFGENGGQPSLPSAGALFPPTSQPDIANAPDIDMQESHVAAPAPRQSAGILGAPHESIPMVSRGVDMPDGNTGVQQGSGPGQLNGIAADQEMQDELSPINGKSTAVTDVAAPQGTGSGNSDIPDVVMQGRDPTDLGSALSHDTDQNNDPAQQDTSRELPNADDGTGHGGLDDEVLVSTPPKTSSRRADDHKMVAHDIEEAGKFSPPGIKSVWLTKDTWEQLKDLPSECATALQVYLTDGALVEVERSGWQYGDEAKIIDPDSDDP